mgnify:CR=1 FL=1
MRNSKWFVAIGVNIYAKAYNIFRIAAIWQGIAAREVAGNAAASNAGEIGALVEPMADAAWAEVKESGR